MKAYIRLMRPQHYLKNLLVFVPLLFSGRMWEGGLLLNAALAFVSFSLLSSVVYIINDIKDADSDRAHSTKRFRPIASGEVKVPAALVLAGCLLIVSVALLLPLRQGPWPWVIAAAYLADSLLYSVAGWKNVALLDVLLLVGGFLLRLLFGAAAVQVHVSDWLSLTVLAISFYLGFGKRRNEMRTEKNTAVTRKALTGYTQGFLDMAMNTCMTLGIVFYSLWSIDKNTTIHHANPYAIWSVPLVLTLAFRYSMDMERGSAGNPVDVILHDKVLWLIGAVYLAMMFWVVYGF